MKQPPPNVFQARGSASTVGSCETHLSSIFSVLHDENLKMCLASFNF